MSACRSPSRWPAASTSSASTSTPRVDELRAGIDRTNEVERASAARLAAEAHQRFADCAGADVYIVTVPTPVDERTARPAPGDRRHRIVAALLDRRARPIIVYESTVYPGVTEEICGPLLERIRA
jgi:UDP-N-acetyl-D-galactosamine dehydrogenase